MLQKVRLPLTHVCTSQYCVNLPYNESVRLAALARCFPWRPILVLWDSKEQKVAESKDTDIVREQSGAFSTISRGAATTVGNYVFRIHNLDVKSAVAVIGKICMHGIRQHLSNSTRVLHRICREEIISI